MTYLTIWHMLDMCLAHLSCPTSRRRCHRAPICWVPQTVASATRPVPEPASQTPLTAASTPQPENRAQAHVYVCYNHWNITATTQDEKYVLSAHIQKSEENARVWPSKLLLNKVFMCCIFWYSCKCNLHSTGPFLDGLEHRLKTER